MSYFEDSFTQEDVCAPVNEKTKRKNTLTEMKLAAKNNYCTVRTSLGNKLSYYKASTTSGSPIVHAITGDYLLGKVGSLHENKYYKVKMSCFGAEQNGTLYYLSPDEYERHQNCVVSDESKDAWLAKRV
jgi:hypothetical protein